LPQNFFVTCQNVSCEWQQERNSVHQSWITRMTSIKENLSVSPLSVCLNESVWSSHLGVWQYDVGTNRIGRAVQVMWQYDNQTNAIQMSRATFFPTWPGWLILCIIVLWSFFNYQNGSMIFRPIPFCLIKFYQFKFANHAHSPTTRLQFVL